MKKIKNGDTVYLMPKNNMARNGNTEIKEVVATNVGTKYFQALNRKFSLETMLHVSGYAPDYKAYLNKQDILDEYERRNLFSSIRKVFMENGSNVCLTQLRAIHAILNTPSI